MRICILGRGRVGGSFATAFTAAEHDVVSLGRDDSLDVVAECDVAILAVPDAAIASAAQNLIGTLPPSAVLVHCSAATPLEVLAQHGNRIGILHPPLPVASNRQSFEGQALAVIDTPESRADLEALVRSIGAQVIRIAPADQVRYHAALVHASNHLVSLAADAAQMLGESKLLWPLLKQTLENMEQLGFGDALTGPIVRGDVETVRAHLQAIPEEMRDSYIQNARRTLALALASGRLQPHQAQAFAEVFKQ